SMMQNTMAEILEAALLQKKVHEFLRNILVSVTDVYSLEPIEWAILIYIATREKTVTAAMLTKALGIKKSNLSVLLKNLRDQELIEERESETDKRKKLLFLSPRGGLLTKNVTGKIERKMNKSLAHMQPEEIQEYLRLQKKMLQPVP